MYKIQTIDGICGAGKTHKTLEYIVSNSYDELFIIAQPTIDVLEETFGRLKAFDSNAKVQLITSENSSNVVSDILKKATDASGIILITHSAFFKLPEDFIGKDAINLFIDEIPDITFEWNKIVPLTHQLWSDLFYVENSQIDPYFSVLLKPGSLTAIDQWCSKKDEVVDIFKPLLLFSKHWASNLFVGKDSWNKLCHSDGDGYIEFYGYYSPSILMGFKSCTIIGANFYSSMLYKIYSQLGIKFTPHLFIKNIVDKHSEDRNKLVSLYYFTDKNWSNTLLKAIDAKNPFSNIIPAIKSVFGDEQFVYSLNNRYDDLGIGTRMPVVVHGRNDWMDISNGMFLTALKSTPGKYNFITQMFGITGDEQNISHAYEIGYQSLMRTSLRNPINNNPVKFIVGDKATANHMALNLFPGCKMIAIKTNEDKLSDPTKTRGRPLQTQKLSQVEKTKRLRAKNREFMSIKNTLYKAFKVTPKISFEEEIKGKTIAESFTDWVSVKNLMKESWEFDYNTKEENFLFTGAEFKKSSGYNSKTIENTFSSNMLILDFDNSPITNKEIRDILWDCNWLLYNSYSNGRELGRNFRVCIPFKFPIDPQYYGDVWDTIVARFESRGYYVKTSSKDSVPKGKIDSGIDKSKRPVCSFFYMPSRPGSRKKEHHIWEEQWNRDFLNPLPIIENPVIKVSREEGTLYINPKSDKLNQVIQKLNNEPVDDLILITERKNKIEKAKERWRKSQNSPKNGNSELFILYSSLSKLMDKNELKTHMESELIYARSPDERKKQLKELLRSK